MCYHYTVPDINLLEKRFRAQSNDPVKRDRIYHVSGFGKPRLPVITGKHPNRIQFLTWGLIPHWVKDQTTANTLRSRTLNARAETIHERPAFRHLVATNRCLVLADGFFEWRHYQGRTYPYYIHLTNHQPFAIAGLWDTWLNPETSEPLKTYTIITTWANPLLERVHNKRKRMPVILHASDEKPWLRVKLSREAIDDLMVPYEATRMTAYPVSRLITTKDAKTNIPNAIKPVIYPELPAIQT